MEIDLLSLLKERRIIHPTRNEGISFCNGNAVSKVSGHPWWLGEKEKYVNSQIEFRFDRIIEAQISEEWMKTEYYEEDMDTFSADLLKNKAWHSETLYNIYCNEPILDPLRIIDKLDNYLTSAACPYSYIYFLNGIDNLENFREIINSNNYLLFSGPKPVGIPVIAELDRQAISHTILSETHPSDNHILVQWWNGFLVCHKATARF